MENLVEILKKQNEKLRNVVSERSKSNLNSYEKLFMEELNTYLETMSDIIANITYASGKDLANYAKHIETLDTYISKLRQTSEEELVLECELYKNALENFEKDWVQMRHFAFLGGA